jgi:L-cysteine desulfidase
MLFILLHKKSLSNCIRSASKNTCVLYVSCGCSILYLALFLEINLDQAEITDDQVVATEDVCIVDDKHFNTSKIYK